MAAGAWSDISYGQRGGRLNWQVKHDDSHLCVIITRLLICALFVFQKKKNAVSQREKHRADIRQSLLKMKCPPKFCQSLPVLRALLPTNLHTPGSTVVPKPGRQAYVMCVLCQLCPTLSSSLHYFLKEQIKYI